jgi:hypothetical protein
MKIVELEPPVETVRTASAVCSDSWRRPLIPYRFVAVLSHNHWDKPSGAHFFLSFFSSPLSTSLFSSVKDDFSFFVAWSTFSDSPSRVPQVVNG